MGVPALETPDVVVPTSPDEAVRAFGDGAGVAVFGGGTILMPDITYGRVRPRRALMLKDAGLAGISREGSRITIGAMTPVAALEDMPQPLGAAAHYVGDPEVRAQATLGGNLCAPPGGESPRGDLQAALVALGAEVRSANAGGERSEPVEDFLASGAVDRLVLDVSFDEPEAGAHRSVRRPHAHAYTILAVCVARTGGAVRVAATGAGPKAVRLRGVEEALADGEDADAAAERALDDADPPDDALASAWYRRKVLPRTVAHALHHLG